MKTQQGAVVINIINDILCTADRSQCVYLLLLNLTMAFNTMDHKVFLRRIQRGYAISVTCLDLLILMANLEIK